MCARLSPQSYRRARGACPTYEPFHSRVPLLRIMYIMLTLHTERLACGRPSQTPHLVKPRKRCDPVWPCDSTIHAAQRRCCCGTRRGTSAHAQWGDVRAELKHRQKNRVSSTAAGATEMRAKFSTLSSGRCADALLTADGIGRGIEVHDIDEARMIASIARLQHTTVTPWRGQWLHALEPAR